MKLRKITGLETPYVGISKSEYQIEKRRLQLELLKIQQWIIKNKHRVLVIFEGRDAAGKGSTIKRFTENLIPAHFSVHSLGIPSERESRRWFSRYESLFPKEGHISFFDRSWYSRALIQPTMGYCTENQYKRFIKKVLSWEHKHIQGGLILFKLYLSVDPEVQLIRFENRITNPLTYWKLSNNDINARKKWAIFTKYKEQMFEYTSSKVSPWVVINSNKKAEARLTSMLHFVNAFEGNFKSLTGEDVRVANSISVGGVKFGGLTLQQLAILKKLKDEEHG